MAKKKAQTTVPEEVEKLQTPHEESTDTGNDTETVHSIHEEDSAEESSPSESSCGEVGLVEPPFYESPADNAPSDDVLSPKEQQMDLPSEAETSDDTGSLSAPALNVLSSKEPEAATPSEDIAAAKRQLFSPESFSTKDVLTVDARAALPSPDIQEDLAWHEIRTAHVSRRYLTGQIGGIEQLESKVTIVIVDYKGFRIVIPLKEMNIKVIGGEEETASERMDRELRLLNAMIGAEIDFMIMGINNKERSVVASRKIAMERKREVFYLKPDDAGNGTIYEGRLVQARIIAVGLKAVRVEVFGVECSIRAQNLRWEWIGDARDHYYVGDYIVVRILRINGTDKNDIRIVVDAKSITDDKSYESLEKCKIQSKYAGRITDIHKGVIFIRLSNGANAIAHTCLDRRTPGKGDDVSFIVTRIDVEQCVATGLIPRIIKQNL